MSIPPKPQGRPDNVSLWRYLRLFRQDILSAQPDRLYRAKMAAFKTPFFQSYMINQPDLIDEVLKTRPEDFPKSDRIAEGLRPLLGDSVFLTNGAVWEKQRRIIDPAFQGGRLRDTFPAMLEAGRAAAERLTEGVHEIEAETSHAAADVIFRSLFSIPIEHQIARDIFERFRDYQRTQPLLNLAAFVPLPRWLPRIHSKRTKAAATDIRSLIEALTAQRQDAIAAGTAPDDLATKIMTTTDPVTGDKFTNSEMVDQVAIFFLAGHETSASALAWALYLLATHPQIQERAAQEAATFAQSPSFSNLSKLRLTRDVFREALRLYPPVPMMVREATGDEVFRNRKVKSGSQVVISPWHLHRNPDHWDNPDGFDPDRYETEIGGRCLKSAYLPFSSGPRVCTGAGFAMVEGPLLLATLLAQWRFEPGGPVPVPVAHLTVRSKSGIRLTLGKR